MYMNLKPNKHKIIYFNITMASLGFIGPPLKFSSPQVCLFAQVPLPPQSFWSDLKLGGLLP